MSTQTNQPVAEALLYDGENLVDESLVETLYQELDQQVPIERVRDLVAEIMLEFQDAAVKTFLPIFIRRRVIEQLRGELDDMDLITVQEPAVRV